MSTSTSDSDTDAPTVAGAALRALRAAGRTSTAPAAPEGRTEVPDVPDQDVEPDSEPDVEPTAEPDAEPDPEPDAEPDASVVHARPGALVIAAAVAAVAALVFAVVAGLIWWRADHDPQRVLAQARDTVATDARLAVATVNTSDWQHPDAAMRNWLDVSTGSLHDEFSDSRAAAVKLLAQARTTTSAIVLDAAVRSLDTRKGTATVIASVNVRKQPAKGAATTTRNRFQATMAKVGDEWKLSGLTIVAVQF